jgi:predicted metalloprotease with PDZ domain
MRVRYTISLARPKTHRIGVTMEVTGLTEPVLRVAMPAWVPGHYAVMDNARQVTALEARAGGRRLAVSKADKQTWEVATGGAREVVVSYDVYARTLSSSASWLGEDQCQIHGATVFLYVVGAQSAPCELRIEDRPRAWRVATGLPKVGPDRWRAADYDVLADSPVKVGTFHDETFRVAGKTHHVVVTDFGHDASWLPEMVRQHRLFVEWFARMFRDLPYEDYWFLYDLHDTRCSGGALEHANSTHLTLPMRIDTEDPVDRERIVVVGAHEYFHLWNVKRMRPKPLGPFDYTKEQHTTDLWVAEGLTDYYCYYGLLRAGVFTPPEYFRWVGHYLDRLNDMPGRRTMSLREASFETWTGAFWRARSYPEESDALNTFVDYYTKGSLVGALLDVAIREATEGRRGLDEVFRRMMRRAGRPEGFPQGEFEDEVERLAGRRVRNALERWVGTPEPVDFRREFRKAGLLLRYEPAPAAYDKAKIRRKIVGRLGLEVDDSGPLVRVNHVETGSPAEAAGLDRGDLLLAFDGERVTKDRWRKVLGGARPGRGVEVAFFRHERLLRETVVPREETRLVARFSLDPKPSASARRVRDAWLGRGVRPFTSSPTPPSKPPTP